MSRQHTSVRAYGVLVRDESVLLVRSSSPQIVPPLWWLPGGGIDFGESPEDTLLREFHEETGLAIKDPILLDVASDIRRRPNGDRIHTVRVLYTVSQNGGELRDEALGTTDQVHWFKLDELSDVNVAEYAARAIQLALEK
ncbi:MAG TPA: NUDIX domain-containing protein [Acidimicrobiales bacterium]|nr:NUDIX domain-containing protein [Acidimicrobiales bacterium]